MKHNIKYTKKIKQYSYWNALHFFFWNYKTLVRIIVVEHQRLWEFFYVNCHLNCRKIFFQKIWIINLRILDNVKATLYYLRICFLISNMVSNLSKNKKIHAHVHIHFVVITFFSLVLCVCFFKIFKTIHSLIRAF